VHGCSAEAFRIAAAGASGKRDVSGDRGPRSVARLIDLPGFHPQPYNWTESGRQSRAGRRG
jgi:hypothetical protein